METPAAWQEWGNRLLWTGLTLGVAYGVGHLLKLFLSHLVHVAAKTHGQWDDIVLSELRRRLPVWALLAGVWYSLRFWDLAEDSHLVAVRALIVLVGLSASWTAATIVSRLIRAYSSEVSSRIQVTGLTQNVARVVIMMVGGLIILDEVGIAVAPLLTVLGVGGLAVGLALQDPLSNLFSGIFISLSGQIRVGDFVELEDGRAGHIVDFDWRSTRLQLPQNSVVIVPNNRLAQAIVTNYDLPDPEVSVVVPVGIDYDTDLARVEQVTRDVAAEVLRAVEGGVPGFEPAIRFQTFAEAAISMSVVLRARQFADQFLIRHEFLKRLHARFKQEGIAMPFPVRVALRSPGSARSAEARGKE